MRRMMLRSGVVTSSSVTDDCFTRQAAHQIYRHIVGTLVSRPFDPLVCHQQPARPSVPISAGHRPYQHVRIHLSPGTPRYFLLYSSGLLPPRIERGACAERGNGAAAPPGNQKPRMQSFGFTLLHDAAMRAALPISDRAPLPQFHAPAADALRCRSWRITEELHAGRNHPPHRWCPRIRAECRDRLVHTALRATAGPARGEEVLWDIDEHATLFIEPDAA